MSAIAVDLIGSRPRARPAARVRPLVGRALRPTEAKLVFGIGAAVYLAVGAVLVYSFGSVLGDALSRAANGSYVLFGRDPHVASIGFDWMPLPSVAMLPFLELRHWFPSIASDGFAANLASALLMAG